jgi:ParB-like chromosome segregation protein Spo0J
MADYNLHEYCTIFPVASEQDTGALVDDIRRHGLLDAITLYDGKILDGRNRYTACQILNVEPRFVDFEGDNEKALEFVVSKNLARRHLNESQRSMIAAKLANMPLGGAAYRNANLHTDQVSRAVAASRLNVSTRSVANARKIINEGIPELTDAVERGDIPVSVAAEVSELDDTIQRQIIGSDDRKIAAKKYIAEHKKAKRQADPYQKYLEALHKAWDAAPSQARTRFLDSIGVQSLTGVDL